MNTEEQRHDASREQRQPRCGPINIELDTAEGDRYMQAYACAQTCHPRANAAWDRFVCVWWPSQHGSSKRIVVTAAGAGGEAFTFGICMMHERCEWKNGCVSGRTRGGCVHGGWKAKQFCQVDRASVAPTGRTLCTVAWPMFCLSTSASPSCKWCVATLASPASRF